MKQRKWITGIATLMAALLFMAPCSAHSGRTDSSGGHRDNKNVSGLGFYHYHCGGHPAHLHPNGVCPYTSGYSGGSGSSSRSSSSSASRSSGGSSYSAPAPTPTPDLITATNVRTFIDGAEIPTFQYNKGGAVVIAEDLANYGFDVYWVAGENTVILYKNPEKSLTPIAMDYYRTLTPGQTLFRIVSGNTRVGLRNSWDAGAVYYPGAVYNLNGYMAISVDELKACGTLNYMAQYNIVEISTGR